MLRSESLPKASLAIFQTQSLAWPLPSLSERNARQQPSGDHFGSQLSPLCPVKFLATPVSTFEIQISYPFTHMGIPVRTSELTSAGLFLLPALTTYANHLPSGENSTVDSSANDRAPNAASTGRGCTSCAPRSSQQQAVRQRMQNSTVLVVVAVCESIRFWERSIADGEMSKLSKRPRRPASGQTAWSEDRPSGTAD
jgi:hypothetical protein